MVTYEISPLVPIGFQVSKTLPGVPGGVSIGHFDTLAEAEAFVHRMRTIDAETETQPKVI
jgi:hypothetical protein